MSTGRPALAPSARWLRDRLQGFGFADDQFVAAQAPAAAQLSEADLEPAGYNIEFASLLQRIDRLLGGGRGVSIFVTGPRADLLARHHLAAQLGAGLSPLGRQVVIVDADVLRPGLSGLLADPDAEGLVDMVRFGRSTRSLLQHPVMSGPWILPSGSFPADDPAPLAADALRSVVFRISQVCDLALYVGPLPIRSDIHPLARVCDHVVCAGSEQTEPETSARLVEQLTELQRAGVHVLGVAWYTLPEPRLNPYETAAAALAVPAATEPLRPLPGFETARTELPPASPSMDSVSEAGVRFSPEGPIEPGFLYAPEETAASPAFLDPGSAPGGPAEFPAFPPPPLAADFELESEPAPASPVTLPDWDVALEPATEPVPARESALFPGFDPDDAKPAREAPPAATATAKDREEAFASEPFDSPTPTFLRRGAGAEPEPADTMRRAADEGDAPLRRSAASAEEYAFESEPTDSRWIPIVVVSLVTLILVFVGWALVVRHRASDVLGSRQPPGSAQVAPPQDVAAHGETAKPAPSVEAAKPATAPPGEAAKSATAPAGERPASGAAPPDDAAATAPKTAPAGEAKERTQTGPNAGTPAAGSKPVAAAKSAAALEAAPPKPAARPPQPPPEPAKAAGTVEAPGAQSAGAPFAVHVASYKTLGQATKDIAQLQKFGYSANAIETDLGSKGMWYRVYVGSYSTVAEAEAARDAILKLPGYNFAQVHRLPR